MRDWLYILRDNIHLADFCTQSSRVNPRHFISLIKLETLRAGCRMLVKSWRTVGDPRIDLTCRVVFAWFRSRRYERAASAGYLAQFNDIWVKVTSSAKLRRHLARSALFRLCLRIRSPPGQVWSRWVRLYLWIRLVSQTNDFAVKKNYGSKL